MDLPKRQVGNLGMRRSARGRQQVAADVHVRAACRGPCGALEGVSLRQQVRREWNSHNARTEYL